MNNWAKIIIGDSRLMKEAKNEDVDLIVTSPPYCHIKDYGIPGQIGYGQSLHEYLRDLYYVWKECYRVLTKGGRFCLNIGDQFARSIIYGRYKVIPIHAEFIAQCEQIGFDFMGSIIWQKKTTMNTTGGANVMGSFPYPPNGIVEIDYEFIHIFKKPGKMKRVSKDIKERSKLTKEEWKEYFSGHWHFGGVKQIKHEAMFPDGRGIT
jgi:DNA modification methylase